MGRPKLLLPLGDRTVLECVIAALQAAGVTRILVVAALELPELIAVARAAGAEAVALPEKTADMRATAEFGLRWIAGHWSPSPADAWLLVPADHPALEPAVVRWLVAAREQHPERSIFVPTHAGQRGHPTLLGWNHVPAIHAFPQERGLNQYFREQSAHVLEVPVEQASILYDLDTPAEYERLRHAVAYNRGNAPAFRKEQQP